MAAWTGRSIEPVVRRYWRTAFAVFPDGLETGQAGWTTAGELAATWVIHVVGTELPRRASAIGSLLTSCYRNALGVADELGASSHGVPARLRGDLRLAARRRGAGGRRHPASHVRPRSTAASVVAYDPTAYDALLGRQTATPPRGRRAHRRAGARVTSRQGHANQDSQVQTPAAQAHSSRSRQG